MMKMTLGDALETAGIGFGTVLGVLALIAVCVIVISKVIRLIENKKAGEAAPAQAEAVTAQAPQAQPVASNTSTGSLELVDVDEKTAAVIMAIVSNESGLPLNRLAFKSIRLLEE